MTFFISLLLLLLAAIALLQVARRLSLPYPAMLALAGVVVALIPGTPTIQLDPELALALFIAPALVDAGFDFPVGAARRLWVPLVALAVVAVLATTGVVATIGWWLAGLPVAAAVALGAIVSPPDAAAATATLRSVAVPRATDAVLKGESLFNDATALILFNGAVLLGAHGGVGWRDFAMLGVAAPGGVLFGIAAALLFRRINHFVAGTLGGTVLQFVQSFLVWIVAERLHLSAVLATVAAAMTLASSAEITRGARARVHSYAVWATVVFLLNVLAFLLMGMQARTIVQRMPVAALGQALTFAGIVVVATIVCRTVVVVAFNRGSALFARRRGAEPPARLSQAFLVSWCGMRGLVTLATAFALPAGFPQRDLIVLTAFAVVLVTLIVQGLTLAPVIRLLGLERSDGRRREADHGRGELAAAALDRLDGEDGEAADELRRLYQAKRAVFTDGAPRDGLEAHRDAGLKVLAAQRCKLDELRTSGAVGVDAYGVLQEELDWRELTLLPEEDRTIEES